VRLAGCRDRPGPAGLERAVDLDVVFSSLDLTYAGASSDYPTWDVVFRTTWRHSLPRSGLRLVIGAKPYLVSCGAQRQIDFRILFPGMTSWFVSRCRLLRPGRSTRPRFISPWTVTLSDPALCLLSHRPSKLPPASTINVRRTTADFPVVPVGPIKNGHVPAPSPRLLSNKTASPGLTIPGDAVF